MPVPKQFSYDKQGNQFWTINNTETTTVDRKMVTAPMLYPVSGTPFGSNFNPDDIVLQTWGTLTLDYGNCDSMTFSYNSTLDEFGAGSYNYIRLTTLAGTSCDL